MPLSDNVGGTIALLIVWEKKEAAPDAPGMLSRHYAPQTTTHVVDDVQQFIAGFPDKRIGVLLFNKALEAPNIKAQEILSRQGNLQEAASKLYAALHMLDEQNLDLIVAERFPDEGMGKAINDRLQRATKK